MNKNIEVIAQELTSRGFDAVSFDTATLARDYLLDKIGTGKTVGIGGSMTAKEMKLQDYLEKSGNTVLWHWLVAPNARPALFERILKADAYISSANAITKDGRLINIDGTGNRVASTFFGPKEVYFVCGKNKIVDGGTEDAIERIKSSACSKNAIRLNLSTPCAKTGHCVAGGECNSPQRMCKVVVELQMPPAGRNIHVLLVDEVLGF